MKENQKRRLEELFKSWGITLNGNAPWDITVHDERFYHRVLSGGSMGLGESYMDGQWDSAHVDMTFERLIRSKASKTLYSPWLLVDIIHERICNCQSKSRAGIVGEIHYDVGDSLYRAMLDKQMIYTCGYWDKAKSLDEAQEAKLHLVAKKLRVEPGMSLLDIGCGWGGAAKFMAENYGANVVGITISRNQVKAGQEHCKGLPVDIRYEDYRDINEQFDRIYSLGMFEHVGDKNYSTYMKCVRRCLRDDGLFLLHTIGVNYSGHTIDPWMNRYIFPNAVLPSASQISRAAEGIFVMEDWHNFGADYDSTLMAWYRNINDNWGELAGDYSEEFHRMWNYYLLICAASFRVRVNQLWQIVFSPHGIPGGYSSVR